MGHSSVWKVLDEMIADFRKRGVEVPAEIVSSLKNAKTMMKITQASAECEDNIQNIEGYLENVQIYLMSEGEKRFGREYADSWLARIDKGSRIVADEEEKEIRFIPGLPRLQKWIRVTPSNELPLESLKTVARELNLSYTDQADGSLLVEGEDPKIKSFVKKVATGHKLENRKQH